MDSARLSHLLTSIAERIESSPIFGSFVSPSASLASGEDVASTEGLIIRDDLPNHLIRVVRPGSPVFIVGGPGSGKTTLWWMLTREAARFETPLVPVPVDVQILAAVETRDELIREALPLDLSEEEIKELDSQSRLLFLIDGLNEIEHSRTVTDKAKRVVASIVRGRERNAVLAMSRSPIPGMFRNTGPLGSNVTEFALLSFGEKEVQALIGKYPELDRDRFYEYLKTGQLEQLAGNPQLLSMLITIFLTPSEFTSPGSVGELFSMFFSAKWKEKAQLIDQPDVGLHTFRLALASLAWHSRLGGISAVTKEAWADILSPFDEIIRRDGLSRQAITDRAHALYLMELKKGGLVFVHERFLDYFTACFLNELNIPFESLWYLREWEQTLALLSGIRSEDGFHAFLDEALKRKRISLVCQIAAANLRRCSSTDLENVFRLVANNLYSARPFREEAVLGLREFAAPFAIDHLMLVLPDIPKYGHSSLRLAVDLLRQSRLTPESYQKKRKRAERTEKSRGRSIGRRQRTGSINSTREGAINDLHRSTSVLFDAALPVRERGIAAKQIAHTGGPAAYEALAKVLTDDIASLRSAVANALGILGDRSAVPALSKALKDLAAEVRGSAATALGVLGDRSAVSALSAALKDEAANVRGSAATALGVLGDRSAVLSLSAALKDEADEVRGSAASALRLLGDRSAVPALSAALKDGVASVRGSAATALGVLGDRSAVSPLSAALKDEAAEVRGSAATALGVLGDRSAVPELCTALKDEAASMRGSAATALGVLGDRSAVPALSAALKDEAAPVRGSAATALGVLGDRSAVPPLSAALKDEAVNVRGSAATALGVLGDRSAVSPLSAALKDEAAEVRGSAATALGVLGDRSAVSALSAALKDGAASVRGSAATALGVLGDRSAVPELCTALNDRAPEVRGSAATALGVLGDRSAVPALIEALNDLDSYTRASAATALGVLGDRSAVPALSTVLKEDQDSAVRGSAASALGAIGDRSAFPALSAAVGDRDAYVRSSIARALAHTRNAGSEGMKVLLRDPNPKVRGAALDSCLAVLEPHMQEVFLETLQKDEDGINRTIAVTGLGLLADAAVIPQILEGLYDPDPGVRGAAALALVKLSRRAEPAQREYIVSRVVRFWIQCRHKATAPAVLLAIKEFPPKLAQAALSAEDANARKELPRWKYDRWLVLRADVDRAVNCEEELQRLHANEKVYLKNAWGLAPEPSKTAAVGAMNMMRTILELDLVSYSAIAAVLEENSGPQAVIELNKQIQGFIDRGILAIGAKREQVVVSTTGDGAILVLQQAQDAHDFARTVHEITRAHNAQRSEASALRMFRMGAATGEIVMETRGDGTFDIAGLAIARAVRLEAGAKPGELVIDIATYQELTPITRNLYGNEEKVSGKRDEEFTVRRCLMNAEHRPSVPAVPKEVPKQDHTDRRQILELFTLLEPKDQLDRLMFLLEVPIDQQPSKLLTISERKDQLLQRLADQGKLAELATELRYLIANQN